MLVETFLSVMEQTILGSYLYRCFNRRYLIFLLLITFNFTSLSSSQTRQSALLDEIANVKFNLSQWNYSTGSPGPFASAVFSPIKLQRSRIVLPKIDLHSLRVKIIQLFGSKREFSITTPHCPRCNTSYPTNE